MPRNLEEYFAYFADWKKAGWKGANISYEYHFWRHQYHDISGIELSKVINNDVCNGGRCVSMKHSELIKLGGIGESEKIINVAA